MNNNQECIICLEILNNDIVILSCGHNFHYKCIQDWIKSKKSLVNFCPLCNDYKNVEIVNIINNEPIIEIQPQPQPPQPTQHQPLRYENRNTFFSCCSIL